MRLILAWRGHSKFECDCLCGRLVRGVSLGNGTIDTVGDATRGASACKFCKKNTPLTSPTPECLRDRPWCMWTMLQVHAPTSIRFRLELDAGAACAAGPSRLALPVCGNLPASCYCIHGVVRTFTLLPSATSAPHPGWVRGARWVLQCPVRLKRIPARAEAVKRVHRSQL